MDEMVLYVAHVNVTHFVKAPFRVPVVFTPANCKLHTEQYFIAASK